MTVVWITFKSHDARYDTVVPGNHKTALVANLVLLVIITLGDTAYLRSMKAIDLVMAVSPLSKNTVIEP